MGRETLSQTKTFRGVRSKISHSDECEDDCLLGCCDMQSGRSLPTFQSCVLPLSRSCDVGGVTHLCNVGKLLPGVTQKAAHINAGVLIRVLLM
jgi:hypothetical protein